MRSVFLVALIATAVFAGSYWYVSTAAICPVPLAYRLGDYDARFSLPPDAVKEVLKETETAWERAAGRDLFTYDESAPFTVNFVFDERQRKAVSEEKLREVLDEKEQQSNETRARVAELQSEYERLQKAYEVKVAAYNRRLATYNDRVAEINSTGGATPEEAATLSKEEKSLREEATTLEQNAKSLTKLVAEVNELGEYGNTLITDYNEGVAVYNDRYGEGGAFTQGEFEGKDIKIYKYSSRDELRLVLAHEFGHALGLDHVEDPRAIMYYLMEKQPNTLTLTAADQAAFTQVCGTGNELTHSIRRFIRTVLAFVT